MISVISVVREAALNPDIETLLARVLLESINGLFGDGVIVVPFTVNLFMVVLGTFDHVTGLPLPQPVMTSNINMVNNR